MREDVNTGRGQHGFRRSRVSPNCCSTPHSDGYAAGLVTMVLEQTAILPGRVEVRRGLTWLVQNQRGYGGPGGPRAGRLWIATSLNKRRNPSLTVGRFMTDAATACAILTLTQSSCLEPKTAALRP
jgi:hypothetical protein